MHLLATCLPIPREDHGPYASARGRESETIGHGRQVLIESVVANADIHIPSMIKAEKTVKEPEAGDTLTRTRKVEIEAGRCREAEAGTSTAGDRRIVRRGLGEERKEVLERKTR